MNPVAPVTKIFIVRFSSSLELLSNHFFAFLPQRFSIVRIERIRAHTFARSTDRDILRHDLSHVAVLAIAPPNLIARSDDSRPHRGCRSLGNGLPPERLLSLRNLFLADLVDECLTSGWIHMAPQFRLNHPRMHGGRTDATRAVPPVKRDREKDVCSLRAAVCGERFVRRTLKIGIGQVHVRKAMTSGRKVDQPTAFPEKRRNPVDE